MNPIVVKLFMKLLEQSAIASALLNCAPKLESYVDYIFEIFKAGKLSDHLSGADETRLCESNIKVYSNSLIHLSS